jgi:hypothetical protein
VESSRYGSHSAMLISVFFTLPISKV